MDSAHSSKTFVTRREPTVSSQSLRFIAYFGSFVVLLFTVAAIAKTHNWSWVVVLVIVEIALLTVLGLQHRANHFLGLENQEKTNLADRFKLLADARNEARMTTAGMGPAEIIEPLFERKITFKDHFGNPFTWTLPRQMLHQVLSFKAGDKVLFVYREMSDKQLEAKAYHGYAQSLWDHDLVADFFDITSAPSA